MATIVQSDQQVQRFLLHHVTWEAYEQLLAALGDRPGLRLNYDGESVEFMTISPLHEYLKKLVARLIEMLCFELNIPIKSGGSFTFKREDVERGLEPDECYWIQNESLVRGARELDFTIHPPPDLAVEVEVTRSVLDRMGIYARLQVPEIWRCGERSIRIVQLQPDGEYRQVETSAAFPFLPVGELVPFLQPDEQVDETTHLRRFVEWVRERRFAESM